jgi:putative acetyltransferase
MKVLETERLILRKWNLEDLEDFYEYARNPNVGPNAGWEPHKDKESSENILKNFVDQEEVWAIVYKENGKAIGSIGMHEDRRRADVSASIRVKMIGYVLSEEYWGKGIMSEACKAVVKYAFDEAKLELLTIFHYPFNIRSKRVIEKCGFRYEGTLRLASKIYDGTVHDSVCYSITKDEFHKFYSEER